MAILKGKKIAILVANGFEQSELELPKNALDRAGAKTEIVSPESGKVRGWKHAEWGDSLNVDVALNEADPDVYDALLLPGGVMNPDKLRMNPKAVQFVSAFADAAKPIAAICHGPWILIDAEIAEGHQLTSWPSIKRDLINAGARWVDKEVVHDRQLVTSRNPDDIPAFNEAMIALFAGQTEII